MGIEEPFGRWRLFNSLHQYTCRLESHRTDCLQNCLTCFVHLFLRCPWQVMFQNLVDVHIVAFHCVSPSFDPAPSSSFSRSFARCRATATVLRFLPSASAIS